MMGGRSVRVKVLGRYWGMIFGGTGPNEDGRCDAPEIPNRRICLRKSLRGDDLLETVIHEVVHAAAFHVDEEYVTEFAADLTRILKTKAIWSRIMEQPKPRGRK